MSLVAELRRRNVFRVAAAYLVVGWLLTEVLTTILPTLGAPPWVSDAVILVFAFGFIPTVILSWVYELTPDGIKRERDVDRDEAVTQKTGGKLDYVTVTAVVLLVIFLGLFSARQSSDQLPDYTAVSTASVAVLPFVNMSADEDNEYFSDGLTETLLHMLTQIPDLKVAARTSSFAFKGQNVSIKEISAALGVAHVLEGSVQRVDDRVRITAQLIRASDGFHVWSDNYDRTLDNIFGIQDEIAKKVGYALSESLLGAAGGGELAGVDTADPDAYDLYLRARRERATFSFGGLRAAEDLLKGALLIDPDFLTAKTELATNYLQQFETGLLSGRDAFSQIDAILEQVLAANPDDILAQATQHYAQAVVRATEGDPEALRSATETLAKLVASSPDDLQIRILLVRAYQGTQQFEKALPVLESASQRDPFNPQILYELGTIYMDLDRWRDARASLERSLEIEPAQPNAYTKLGNISLEQGDGVDFVQQFLKAIEVDPRDQELPGSLAAFLYQLELFDEGDDFRNRVVAIAPTSPIAYRIELLRGINSRDEEASIASARRAIEDDIDDRRFAYGGAAQHLLRTAATRGTVAEEIAYLEAQAPGILDIEADSVPMKHRAVQFSAFDAWYVTLPKEEVAAKLDRLLTIAKSYGFEPEDDPATRIGTLALQGRSDEAAAVGLAELFTEPVSTHLGWERDFAQAQYSQFRADPAVQAALHHWEAEEDALRETVRTFLAELQAAT